MKTKTTQVRPRCLGMHWMGLGVEKPCRNFAAEGKRYCLTCLGLRKRRKVVRS